MGGSESTRKVTIEKDTDGDSPGIIKVSERVVQRLRGKKDLPLNLSEEVTPEEINKLWKELQHEKSHLEIQKKQLEDLLQRAFDEGRGQSLLKDSKETIDATEVQKLKDDMALRENDLLNEIETLKKKNASISIVNEEQFNAAVEEVKEKFRQIHRPTVCQSIQQLALDCYQQNPNKTLICSQYVKDFEKCVQQSRIENLQDIKS